MPPVHLATLVALTSAAMLGFEIALMRILLVASWHHFAFMVISNELSSSAKVSTEGAVRENTQSKRRHFTANLVGFSRGMETKIKESASPTVKEKLKVL